MIQQQATKSYNLTGKLIENGPDFNSLNKCLKEIKKVKMTNGDDTKKITHGLRDKLVAE